jgi:hypothetical protein
MKVSNCCGADGNSFFFLATDEECELEETDLNTINTENEQRISKTGLPTGTSGTDKKNLSEGRNG